MEEHFKLQKGLMRDGVGKYEAMLPEMLQLVMRSKESRTRLSGLE